MAQTLFLTQIALCVVLWSMLVQVEAALECYTCNSYSEKNCETVSSGTRKENNCKFCLKVYQQLDGVDGEDPVVVRGCVKEGEPANDCDKRELRSSLKSDVCSCSTALCNSARDTRVANWVLVLLAGLAVVVLAYDN